MFSAIIKSTRDEQRGKKHLMHSKSLNPTDFYTMKLFRSVWQKSFIDLHTQTQPMNAQYIFIYKSMDELQIICKI